MVECLLFEPSTQAILLVSAANIVFSAVMVLVNRAAHKEAMAVYDATEEVLDEINRRISEAKSQ